MTSFGSDLPLKIVSQIMQTFFHSEKYREENGAYSEEYEIRLLALISELLLQIRKDIYSSKTKLKRAGMVEFMLIDMKESRMSRRELNEKVSYNH